MQKREVDGTTITIMWTECVGGEKGIDHFERASPSSKICEDDMKVSYFIINIYEGYHTLCYVSRRTKMKEFFIVFNFSRTSSIVKPLT